MRRIKSSIPKTNICKQIIHKFNIHIATSVFDQIDRDLQYYGLDMITDKVNYATIRSIDVSDCVIDIMKLL